MSITKDLGLIKAIHVGLIAPTSIEMLWYDTNIGIKYHKYYDTVDSIWKPLKSAGGSSPVFAANVTFLLSGGKSFGKYLTGQTADWIGKTAIEAIADAAIEYIAPSWSSFSISGQAATVEIGTIISGSKTFTWGLNQNSGVISGIDVYDITGATTLLAGTPNDGTQAVVVATVSLLTHNQTQSWRGIGNNTSPIGTINSSSFTVIAKAKYWWSALSTTPTTSAEVRAMSNDAFYGAGTFTLNTGSTLNKFTIVIPNASSITQAIDLDALNLNITSEYLLLGTIVVNDIGGNAQTYKLYEMNQAVPYSSNHRHSITIS